MVLRGEDPGAPAGSDAAPRGVPAVAPPGARGMAKRGGEMDAAHGARCGGATPGRGSRAAHDVTPRPEGPGCKRARANPARAEPSVRDQDLCRKKYLTDVPDMPYSEPVGRSLPQPVEIHEHAMDNLRYIRRTMERAGSFTAVSGLGGMLMGSSALAAAWLADRQPSAVRWLAVWMAEGLVAMVIGIVAAALKSRRAKTPLLSGPGYKFIAGFTPALAAGALLSFVLFRAGQGHLLPGTWLLLTAPAWYPEAALRSGSFPSWAPVSWRLARLPWSSWAFSRICFSPPVSAASISCSEPSSR